MEAVFSVHSVPRLYNNDQLPLLVSCEPVKGGSLEAAVGEFSQGADSWRKYQLKPAVRVWNLHVSPEAEECPLLAATTKQRV
jgi:hypothetical protein